nr:uncharacterized protein LOC123774635 [Procambarus clarkii]
MMWSVWVMWVAITSTLAYSDKDPSEVTIDSLTLDELNNELKSRLESLQNYIERRYEERSRQHEANIQKMLSRTRRDATGSAGYYHHYVPSVQYKVPVQPTIPVQTTVPVQPTIPVQTTVPVQPTIPTLPTLAPGYWHSYTYNSIVEREMVKIDSIAVSSGLGSVSITHAFPLRLTNLPAICRSDVGWGVLPRGGKMVAVRVRNSWTQSVSGCRCDVDNSMNCACCSPGGCLCKRSEGHPGDTCVKCGKETSHVTCQAGSNHPLELDAAVGLEYHLDSIPDSKTLQQVLVTAKDKTVSFLKIDAEGAQSISFITGNKNVTHLGYGEVLVNFFGTLKQLRFLVIFSAGQLNQEYREITVSTTENVTISIGLGQSWVASGTEMKTWQAGRRVLVGVLQDRQLLLHEMKENSWREFQMKVVQKVTFSDTIASWTTFSSGLEHQLLVVTASMAKLFVLRGAHYQARGEIFPSHGLSTFNSFLPVNIPSCRDEVVLLTGQDALLVAYVWNGTARAMQVGYTTTLDMSVVSWERGYESARGQPVQVVVQGRSGVTTLDVKTALVPLLDPVIMENKIVHDTMNNLQMKHNQQTSVVEAAARSLANSVDCGSAGTSSGSIVIDGSVTLHSGMDVLGVFNTTHLEAQSMGLRGTEMDGASYSTYKDHLVSLGHYNGVLGQISSEMIMIGSTLDDAVPASGSSRVVGGYKTLLGADLHLDTLSVFSLDVEQMLDGSGGRVPIHSVFGNIVKRNESVKVAGRKTFTNGLYINTLYTPHLDDIPVSDLVTLDGRQTIAGATFSTLVAGTIAVKEGSTVAGIDLSKNVVLLSGEAVLGHCTLSKGLMVKNNVQVLSNMVNGMDLSIFKNTLKKSGGTLAGSLAFLNTVSVSNLKATEIMGINVDNFMSTTVFKDRTATMTGNLIVPSTLTVNKDLTVTGHINGDGFPSRFPLRTDSTLRFGAKRFSSLQFGSVTVSGGATVDGLNVSRLVTLDTVQQISGRKIFAQGVDIKGNLDITSAIIGGVNLNTLTKGPSLSHLTDWRFDVEFMKPVYASSVQCAGKVNDLNFAELAADVVYTDGTSLEISGSTRFALSLNLSNAVFKSTFNGEMFENLVTTARDFNITGNLIFKTDVQFDSLRVTGAIGGVDVAGLAASALYLNKSDQVVRGKLVFRNPVSAASLDVSGKINNVNFLNAVTRSGVQNFSAPQTLKSATFGAVKAHAIDMSEGATVNTVDISELAKRRVKLNSADSFNGTLNVEGKVTILGSLSAVYINGFNIQQLKENIVTDNVSSTISGTVIFTNLNVDQSVTTSNLAGANGLNISDINANAVHLASDNFLSGWITWGDLALLDNVTVGGLVNGIDLREFAADAVYKDTTALQIITGKKTFQSGITVKGDVHTLTTNRIDLATSLFTLHTDQVLTAAYYFNNIRAQQMVHLVGLVCNVDLKKLVTNTLRRGEDSLVGTVNFHDVVNVTDFKIRGALNALNVQELLRDAIRKLDTTNVAVTGTKTFTAAAASTITFRNIKVGFLNMVNFDEYLAHLVLKNSPAHLTLASVSSTLAASAVTSSTLVLQGTIDGIDYSSFLASAVHLTGDQTINSSLVFTDVVTVSGNLRTERLNSLVLDTDYLTTSTNQTIPVNASFSNVTTGNVMVAGKVNNWNLPDAVRGTMTNGSGQVVTGLVTFSGAVEVSGNVEVTGSTGTTVKVKLSQQVIALDDTATIEGVVVFNGPLTVASLQSTTGIINGIYLSDLYHNAWYVDQETTITGRLVFSARVIFMQGLIVVGQIGQISVDDLYRETTHILAQYSNKTEQLKKEYGDVCEPITAIYEQLQSTVYEGDYFLTVGELQMPHNTRSSTSFQTFNVTCVVMTWEGMCDSVLYTFDPTTVGLVQKSVIPETGNAHQWLYLEGTNKVLLAMVGSEAGNNCTRKNSLVWKLEEGSIQVHQELVAGEGMSAVTLDGGSVALFIHTLENTVVYRLDPTTEYFTQVDILPGYVGIAVTVKVGGRIIMFWASGSLGKLMVDGVFGEALEFPSHLLDAVMFEQAGSIFLVLVVRREMCTQQQYDLELYEVNLRTKTVTCVDRHDLAAPADLIAFYAGNEASGSTIVMAIKHNVFPLAYKLVGQKLRIFSEECPANVLWAQHVRPPGQKFPQLADHYIFLGRNDSTILITKLIMRGAALPTSHLDCDNDAFGDPHLIARAAPGGP